MADEPWAVVLATLAACLGPSATRQRLARAYDTLAATDLSRDVLERRPQDLRVVRVAPCGWSDLGTPSRLEPFLVGQGTAA
jgi:hypothetical protein